MVHATTAAKALPFCAALSLLAFATIGAIAQPGRPDFTGTWVLEKSKSDNPARPRSERSTRGGGSGVARQVLRGVSVFGIPVGSLPLPAGHEPDPLESDDLPGAEQVLSEVTRIRILQEGSATEFDYGGPLTATYEHGSRAENRDGSVHAGWKADIFEVVHVLKSGTTITETYLIDAADELHWLVRLKQKKADAIVVERVFAREVSLSPPPTRASAVQLRVPFVGTP